MEGKGKKWLIGCGVGCGTLILLSILLSIGGALFLSRPMDRAVDTQKELIAAHGERDEYTPPVELDPERIEIFLVVRKEMMPHCARFEALLARFRAMNEIEDDEKPSAGEVFQGIKGVMGAAFSMAPAMGGALEARNTALNEHGMGLGEYTWIYVLAYNSYLGRAPNTGIDDPQGRGYCSSKLSAIIRLMENHAGAFEAAGLDERAAVWRDEAGRLLRVDDGVPFTDGSLPAGLERAFAPYRIHLEKTYCAAMAEFDLERIEKKGMSFHTH